MSQRLTLTELMPIAWTRLTRYKLLIENIFHSYKKNWDDLEGGCGLNGSRSDSLDPWWAMARALLRLEAILLRS